MSDTPKIITFIDHIGRTLLAEFVEDVDGGSSFIAKNPAIIHVQPTQQGQLNVQTIPLFFREFVGEKSKNEGTKWKFHYATVVLGLDVDNDPRLIDQYTKLFAEPSSIVTPKGDSKVVKLFDE